MGNALEFTLNGRRVRAENISTNTTLLDYLRGRGLTGSKEGCAEGDCGACSVAIVDRDEDGRTCYRAINSCLVPICLMAGREIISVEGVAPAACHEPKNKGRANGDDKQPLHPVQREMVNCHGSQCGYCTPGFILSLLEGYYRHDIENREKLEEQLCGNLCRCTGYRSIIDAAALAFSARHKENGNDPLAERLTRSPGKVGEVKYGFAGERFSRPSSLRQLLEMKQQNPEGQFIAGATELGLEITKKYRKFRDLISVEGVPELKRIRGTDSEWHIGGAVTLTVIEDKLSKEFPALGKMLRVFGSRQIRNRATMGGNIVTASPIGDSAPILLALGASVVLASLDPIAGKIREKRGMRKRSSQVKERILAIDEFFIAYRKTALRPGEILKSIILPRAGFRSRVVQKCEWYKVSKRREMDISTVAACFRVDLDGDGVVAEARLAYGGVSAMPVRARKVEAGLVGKLWDRETVREALPVLHGEFTPISDVRGDADYRQALIGKLFEKFYYDSTSAIPDADQVHNPSLNSEHNGELRIPDGTAGRNSALNGLGHATAIGDRPAPHESAVKHVTGEAMYTDDHASAKKTLEVWPVCSPYARAKILKRDATAARTMHGIYAVLLAEDIPGINDIGTRKDEVLFPQTEVSYHGQIVALVVGDTLDACRAAAERVVVEYKPLKPVLKLSEAIALESFHNEPNYIRRGKIKDVLRTAPLKLTGTFELGGQEHFYLETHAAWAEPGEDDSMFVMSSTQHPSEVQAVVAHVLHVTTNKVVVQCPRMGGGFGGKETQAALPAALAALAARVTGKSVRVRFNRDQDMMLCGHRHPFRAKFEVGFNEKGLLLAAKIHLYSNGGWAMDLSQAVTDRALFHLDNSYYIPSVEFRGQVAKTNLSSNTAFRGFGGPQGMLVIEEIIDRMARRLALPPEAVRERNLYRGKGETNTTHYGQELREQRLTRIWAELKESSEMERRRSEIAEWNDAHSHRKRGLAMTPVKFGISFTVTHLNQAGALVLIYQDGTVQVNHGGTEMGQGIQTNISAIVARELGLLPEQIRLMPTSTDKVPNTSATAASCGTDLNGAAVQNACEILRARLLPIAVQLLKEKFRKTAVLNRICFRGGRVYDSKHPEMFLQFAEIVRAAYVERISLSASGYYQTPGIHWDRAAGRGIPFHYFACGAAVAEVEVDGFTGMHRLLRADILHDVGDSINEGINRGQIEGGFVQGMGWLTAEELKWGEDGRLLTHSPDTYKIPAIGDIPPIFNVRLLQNATQDGVIYGSKAVGEPPLMLAISVREAIRDAVAAFGDNGKEVPLASPATSEGIFMAIQATQDYRAVKRAARKPARSASR